MRHHKDSVVRLFHAYATPLFGQRRVLRDTIRIDGRPIGITDTNRYCIEGEALPAFGICDQNGKTIQSEDLLGKTVVVSFRIGSCVPIGKSSGVSVRSLPAR